MAEPAERGTRLGAAILDNFIFALAFYVPLLFLGMAAGAADEGTGAAGALAVIGLGLGGVGFIAWCWFTLLYMHRNGQSIAKKLLSIKVVRSDGSPVSLGRLIGLRNVVVWFLSLIPLFGLIDVLFIFGESRQCLHDKIADTIVVRA